MSFLSPLFLAGRAGRGGADRAAPAEARAGDARPVLRRAPAAPCAGRAHRAAGGCASCCCWRCAWRRCCCWRSPSRGRFSLGRRRARARRTIVALDTSLSMSAPGQFERRAQLANRRSPAHAGDPVAVVTFSDVREVAAPAGGDRATAHAAIDAAQPGSARTRYRAGLNAAADLLAAGRGTIVVVTDLQETGWDAGDRASVPESVRSRSPTSARRRQTGGHRAARIEGDRVWRRAQRGPAPACACAAERARLARLDELHARRGRKHRTGRRGPVRRRQLPLAAGALGVGRVSTTRRAPATMRRFLVLDTAARPTVLVVTTSGDLARDALLPRAGAGRRGLDGRAYAVEGAGAGDLVSWDQARLDAHTAIVLDSTRALEHHGRELLTAYLKKGGGMIVAAGPDVDGDVLQELLGGPAHFAGRSRRRRSRRANDANLGSVGRPPPGGASLRFDQRRPGARPVPARVGDSHGRLSRRSPGSPAANRRSSTVRRGDGHALVIASDLDNRGNDFPLHATFVPFLHESLRYLAGSAAARP